MFRKYAIEDDNLDEQAGSGLVKRRPLKGTLLFPRKESQSTDEDEEASTDVEDVPIISTEPESAPQTPVRVKAGKVGTPSAAKYSPISPPDTRRVTRSTDKIAKEPITGEPSRMSPFDSWRRTKSNRETGGLKRQGDSLAYGDTKRARV